METRYKRQSSLNLLSNQLSKRIKIDINNNNDVHTYMDIDKCEEKTIINNVQASIFIYLLSFNISSIYIGCKLRLREL